jgi:5-methylcytosine-specific restriction endonuclease McrA
MTKYNQKLKRLRKKADRLWGKICLEGGKKCEYCGQPAQDPHHFIPKSLSSVLRYDLQNCIPLCRRCHWLWHNRADGSIYAKIVLGRGEKWANHINRKRNKIVKTDVKFYEDAIKKLEKVSYPQEAS